MNALEVSGLTVHYHDSPVLWDIDFTIPPGALVGILGPNGAGKSTLLKAILGLVPRVSGNCTFMGSSFEKMRKKIAYVPQREAVDWDFPITVEQLVLMGSYQRLTFLLPISKEEKAKALACLEKVGMEEYRDRQISELSGGQQQRVFLARALMQDASCYLLDEPLAGVDHATEEIIMELLRELVKEKKTVLMVHHDLGKAREYFSYVLLLNVGLVASGPISEVFTKSLIEQTYRRNFDLLDEAFKRSSKERHGSS